MDHYENEVYDQAEETQIPEPDTQEGTCENMHTETEYTAGGSYSGSGAGRKESPFADSPYIMEHQTGGYQENNGYGPGAYAAPVQPKRKKEGKKVWKSLVASLLTVAVVAGGCGITAAVVDKRWEDRASQMEAVFNDRLETMQQQIEMVSAVNEGVSVSGTPMVAGDSLTPAQVYAKNVNSVVLISSTITTNSMYGPTTGASTGSGFVLTEDGYVITNHHVIDGATAVTVTTYGGEEFAAKIIGSDATNDVALLKVEAVGLDAVEIGSSDKLIVGDQVVAIGNPLGELTSTMTVGYVSAKDRDVTTDGTTINMLQTDVAINSGNSGGPLFNMKGEVVGITTAKYSGSSSSGATIEGIGFAIPIDDVYGILDSLRQYGYVTGAYLGVSVSDVDSSAQYYGVPAGAYVAEVVAGYCAFEAGVKAGDIIIDLGGHEVESYTDLSRALRKFEPGDTTQITVYRNGQEITLTITLDEKPNQTASSAQTPESEEQMPQDGSYEEWYNYFAPFFGNGRP